MKEVLKHTIMIVYMLLVGFLTWKVHWAMIFTPLIWHPDFESKREEVEDDE